MRSDLNRRFLLAGLAAVALPAPGHAASPCWVPRVLFVCPMGSVKSAIARERLRREAKARGFTVDVHSRGVKPALDISPGLASNLRREGIDPLADPIRQFTKADADRADITIAFDEAASAPGLENARKWHSPSWNDDYANAKAAMDKQIPALADELAKRSC
jgi:protein-tyrosine-phosphatase